MGDNTKSKEFEVDSYWGLTKEEVIKQLGKPQETEYNENFQLDEIIYWVASKEIESLQTCNTYCFSENRLIAISTGYDFEDNLYTKYDLYHLSLIKGWHEELKIKPTQPCEIDKEGNYVTIFNTPKTRIVICFNPKNPSLTVVQQYRPEEQK